MKVKLPDGTEVHGTYEEVSRFIAHMPMQILDSQNHQDFKIALNGCSDGTFVDMTQTYRKPNHKGEMK